MSKPSVSSSAKTREVLYGLLKQLTKYRQRQLALLLILMISSSIAELGSLSAVFPLLTVLNNPDQAWNNFIIIKIAPILGLKHSSELFLPLTIIFILTICITAAIRILNLWANSRLAASIGTDLSTETFKRTLYQPYETHLQENSSRVIASITTQVARTIAGINAALTFCTSVAISSGLLFGLLLIDWKIASLAIAVIGSTYCIIAFNTKKTLKKNSSIIVNSSAIILKILQEGLGAIREVLLGGNQKIYINAYRDADRRQRILQAMNFLLSAFPRYFIEAIGMTFLALIGLVIALTNKDSTQSILPLLGTLALGAQRLLPAVQQAYGSWASLNGFYADMNTVLEIVTREVSYNKNSVVIPLTVSSGIEMCSIEFAYQNNKHLTINKLNCQIEAGERIGIRGSTGSGKSTFVDLLMGLLIPSRGLIYIDGLNLHDPDNDGLIYRWRASISHVPQTIYLADSSIKQNIAFGTAHEHIDMNKVKACCKAACLSSLIESLDKGYDTYVGERGVRLSGGQRQRIGIARALYKNSAVLILDEATSALDTKTEERVMEGINSFDSKTIIIMIAHRLSTLNACRRIFHITQGKILEE